MRKTILLSLLMLSVAFSAISGINRVSNSALNLLVAQDTVTVSTLDSLKSAIGTATTDRLILLRKCTDAAGYYALGTAGINYPTVFVSLELKNYPGDTATLYGSFTSATGRTMKLNSLTFNGLTFKRVATGDGEGQTPFYFLKADTLHTGMYVRNCTFKDLGGSGSARLFYAKSAGVKCGEVVFENNVIDNFGGVTADGAHGQTMFQFGNYLYSCDKLIVRKNLIRDYHGNQFINNSRQTMPTSVDSSMSITVEGNSFIRFGGNGTSDRNFIEWTNKMAGVKGYVTIKDNFFYKNWSTKYFKCWRLHLFAKDSAQVQEVRVLNNYFDPIDVVKGLPITSTTKPQTVKEYNNYSKESFALVETFVDDSLLIMSTKSPLYTASTTGGPIGLASMYTSDAVYTRTEPLTLQVNCLTGLKNAIANAVDGDTIELLNCVDAKGYYKLGTTGLAYPAKFVNLTIRPAAGQSPIVYGSFASNGTTKMKLKNLVFDNVTFKGDLTDLAENNHPFYLQANDSIMGGVAYNKCLFEDLGGAASGPRIFYAKSCTNAVLNKLVYDGCTFKNFGGAVADGATGNHFLHLNNAAYRCDSIVLKNSLISDWHGSQFINIGRGSTTNKDSLFTLICENNTFVRFGGNATSNRNFVECTKDFGGGDVSIIIRNNLFYGRWGKNMPVQNLALFTPKVGQILKVDVLNNFFEPTNIVNSLPVSAGAPTSITRLDYSRPFFAMSTPTFINDTLLIMSKKSPLYTAGTNGVPIGIPSMYSSDSTVVRTTADTLQVNNLVALQKAISTAQDGDVVELLNSIDAGSIYNLGTAGVSYPASFINLTLRKAAGNSPVLFGSLRSAAANGRMKMKTYTVDSLTWNATGMTDSENAAPFYMQAADSVMTALNLSNCSFINMGKSGGARIIDANSCDKSVVKVFKFEGNLVDNFGYTTADSVHGQTFMQWRNSGTYEFDNIILKNNTIRSWHGNQFLNVGRNITNNPDSTLNITIENNTFYKFGGNGTSARNFIETPTAGINGTKSVNIKVNNNLFYKTYGKKHRSGKIQVTNSTDAAIAARYNVQSLNNYFYGDTVMCPSPTSTYKGINLPVVGTPVYAAYKAFTRDSLGITTKVFVDEAKADSVMDLTMYKLTPLFTSGIGGVCIGDPRWYTSDATPPTGIKTQRTEASKLIGFSSNGMIFVKGANKPVVVYNVVGQRLGVFTAEEAERGISIRNKGMVIVNSEGQSIRLMVR